MTPSAVGLRALELLRAGEYAQVHALFAASLQSLVTPELIQAGWEPHGAVTSVGEPVAEAGGVRIPVTFAQGAATVVAGVNEDGRLTGLQIAAAGAVEPWAAPAYADPAALSEQPVTAVPGNLTLPIAPGPHPAVVMLGGSGPVDRDETIGRNKPFKDIAWGLAAAGVASLRFDKVKPSLADFTLEDEYVRPALAAVEVLRQQDGVDPARVFVLGHSLGGTLAPRVAAAANLAGIVLLAAGAQPMHWAAVRQVRYLASLSPGGTEQSQPIIDALTEQARAVDNLSPGIPAAALPFGVPASYWQDVRDYDACATAAALGKPVLALQGGRDYQATVDDDLALWRAALPGATVRVYDADNHLFFTGSGPSTPAEYEPAQHVDPAVIADIAAWIRTAAS